MLRLSFLQEEEVVMIVSEFISHEFVFGQVVGRILNKENHEREERTGEREIMYACRNSLC